MRDWLLTTARRALFVLGLLALLYALKPGAPAAEATTGKNGTAGPLRVALFVNGSLGDKSFYDSADRGLKQAKQQLGLRSRVIEAGLDPTRWEPAFVDLVEGGGFDVVITGGFAMVDLVQRVAPRFPALRFIVFDASVDYRRCACGNVHSLLFRQNEGAYLAGWLAARIGSAAMRSITTDPAAQAMVQPLSKGPLLGVVGAMQVPVIDDFIIGFGAGARAAHPGAQVQRQYVNSFTDPATAKEIAKALYGQGAALVFHAAAGSGQGVIEAAAEAGRPTIGVDSDQYALFQAANPERARVIVTSVLKNVDAALLRALQQHFAGRLAYGQAESLGLREGGVSLARGSPAMETLPPTWLAELARLQQHVVDGSVVVPSAFKNPLPSAVAGPGRAALPSALQAAVPIALTQPAPLEGR